MQTLYRKYRPQLWKEVFGQDVIKNVLTNQILTGKISHAYIFAGSRGIGKTTIARLFAKTLNCKDRKKDEIEPCNKCENCVAINNSNDLNIIEIDAASYTGVDSVRELRNIAKVPPSDNKYKIFIIDEAHMLSKAAFNALLKILEEPPERVIFILATTEINKILDTILSRCQIFKFKKATKSEILEDLKFIINGEKIEVDENLLNDIADKSLGGFRDAESLLGQIISSTNELNIHEDSVKNLINKSNNDLTIEFVSNIINKNIKDNLEIIEKIKDQEISFPDFVLDLIEFFRKILIYKYNNEVIERWSNLERGSKNIIMDFSAKTNFHDLDKIIRKLIDAKVDMGKSDIVELPLELTMIELCNNDKFGKAKHEKDDDGDRGEDKHEKDDGHEDLLRVTEHKISKKIDINFSENELNNILNDKEDEKKPEEAKVVDLEKRDRLLEKFGIKKGLKKIEKQEEDIVEIEKEKKEKAQEEQSNPGVSVLDILQEEFKNEIIN